MTHILTDVAKLLKRRVRILRISFGNLWGFLIIGRLHDIGMFACGLGRHQPVRAQQFARAWTVILSASPFSKGTAYPAPPPSK